MELEKKDSGMVRVTPANGRKKLINARAAPMMATISHGKAEGKPVAARVTGPDREGVVVTGLYA